MNVLHRKWKCLLKSFFVFFSVLFLSAASSAQKHNLTLNPEFPSVPWGAAYKVLWWDNFALCNAIGKEVNRINSVPEIYRAVNWRYVSGGPEESAHFEAHIKAEEGSVVLLKKYYRIGPKDFRSQTLTVSFLDDLGHEALQLLPEDFDYDHVVPKLNDLKRPALILNTEPNFFDVVIIEGIPYVSFRSYNMIDDRVDEGADEWLVYMRLLVNRSSSTPVSLKNSCQFKKMK